MISMSSAKIAFYNNTHYKISVKNYNGIRPVRNRTGHRRKDGVSEKRYRISASAYSEGVMPYWALKHLVKYDGLENPTA